MTKHTPGPWEWERHGLYAQTGNQFVLLAVGDNHIDCSPASKRLIAAAPDLLAACEAHGEVADHRRACQKCGPEHYCWTALALLQRTWQMTEPAIAKAKGE